MAIIRQRTIWGKGTMEIELNLMKGYLEAYRIASENLIKGNHEEISLFSNSFFNKEENYFLLNYLNNDYIINCKNGEVYRKSSTKEVASTTKVLLLHYLLNAQSKPLSGKLISFKELKNGASIYYQTFYKRAITPLIKTFENNFDGLYKAASILNGTKENYGHASVTIRVLPLVPITYVLWRGDEEVPASGTILFDDSIEHYLPSEDIVCAASFGVYALMALARGNG